jgi:hypothetical protein
MQSSAGLENATFGQGLSLNVYLDNTGKALVTGYAENVSGLEFLNTSQFRFENDTRQLYALTDGLTTKVGDLWTIRFDARGVFDDYHVTFYLPSEIRLGMINTSTGLGYLLSASNESLVADVQGYEVSNPTISIQYQQPLAAAGALPDVIPPFSGSNGNIIMLLVATLLVTALALAIVILRRRSESLRSTSPTDDMKIKAAGSEIAQNPAKTPLMTETENSSMDSKEDISPPNQFAASPLPEDDGVYLTEASEASLLEDLPRETEPSPSPSSSLSPSPPQSRDDQIQRGSEPDQISPPDAPAAGEEAARCDESPSRVENAKKIDIVISSEMEAVMQTLTAREQAVMTTLIDHGGRMTQADIRYETRTPKSSLTGILISLERRKLVTKKEWGRTNIIELSSWFLSKKERS